MNNDDTITIGRGEMLRTTDKAIYVRIDGDERDHWFLRSQLAAGSIADDGDRGTLIVTKWFAENGLKPQAQRPRTNQKPIENRPGSGVAFRDTNKTNDKAPDWRGGVNISGIEYRLAVWESTSSKGVKYLSFKVELPRNASQRREAAPGDDADLDAAFSGSR